MKSNIVFIVERERLLNEIMKRGYVYVFLQMIYDGVEFFLPYGMLTYQTTYLNLVADQVVIIIEVMLTAVVQINFLPKF